jgi:hypothetical protein
MRFNKPIIAIIIIGIRFYQRMISPIVNHWSRCRFYPTCSEYAIIAITKYGLKVGTVKAYHRLLRCRPDNLETCIDFP